MVENPNLEEMGSDHLSSIHERGELEDQKRGAQKISVANGLEYTGGHKSDSFIVDIERFSSQLADKDILNANSRITLQRSLLRKGSQRGVEKKTISSITNERDNSATTVTSPRATLHGASTPEKAMAVVVGATDHSHNPQVNNATTIMTGCGGATATESKTINRKFSFRRSTTPSWTIDPRRILFFFATISSMGTILLIYFTLSMSKLNIGNNGPNW